MTRDRGYYFQTGTAILREFMNDLDSPKSSFHESDLLDPYEKLVAVEILGKEVLVPEKNR